MTTETSITLHCLANHIKRFDCNWLPIPGRNFCVSWVYHLVCCVENERLRQKAGIVEIKLFLSRPGEYVGSELFENILYGVFGPDRDVRQWLFWSAVRAFFKKTAEKWRLERVLGVAGQSGRCHVVGVLVEGEFGWGVKVLEVLAWVVSEVGLWGVSQVFELFEV